MNIITRLGRILSDLYQAIWENTTGWPFTYIVRSESSKRPRTAFLIVVTISSGLIIGAYCITNWLLEFVMAGWFLTIGHVYWDTAGSYLKKKSDFTRRKNAG